MLNDESKRVVEEVAKCISARVLDVVIAGAGVDALEDVVVEMARAVGRRALEQATQARIDAQVEAAKRDGFHIQRSVDVEMTGVFGPVTLVSPYLRRWSEAGVGKRPARELGVEARGRTRRVQRALLDFGSEESYAAAAKRFEEHYGIEVDRTTILRLAEEHGERAERFVAARLDAAVSALDAAVGPTRPGTPEILVELDGCEIRTGRLELVPESTETTAKRQLPKRRRITEWRDVRMGLARPLNEAAPTYIGEPGTTMSEPSRSPPWRFSRASPSWCLPLECTSPPTWASSHVTERLRLRLEEVSKTLPAGIEVTPVYQRTTLVDRVLETVRTNLLEGALLVVAVLFLFLGSIPGRAHRGRRDPALDVVRV